MSAGYICSHKAHAYIRTSLDNVQLYRRDTSARCVPCDMGQYCPAGTYEGIGQQAEALALARVCPAGSFCPDSASIEACPAGTYCIEGSSQQYTCNYSQLLLTDAYAQIPAESPTVVERIYLRGDPLGGNYCPAGADTPLTKCGAMLRSRHALNAVC